MSTAFEEHQQHLLATIIKWTNIAILLAVVVNSYFLLTDFWPTLLQNLAVLLVVAMGLFCLRLSRQGHMRRAARIYVSTSMVLMSLLVLVLSPAFILNGAFALALMVLIATYLDSPDNALRWGAVSMALYAAVLTLRLMGPFDSLDLEVADIATLYVLPMLGLLAFALLGRHATGRISESLRASEAARLELSQSNEALQHALDEADRNHRLLLALSHAARAVHRSRTPEEVYRKVGDEVKALDLDAGVCLWSKDGEYLELVYLTYPPEQIARAEAVIGSPLIGHRWRLGADNLYRQPLETGHAILSDGSINYMADVLPLDVRPRAGELRAVFKVENSVIAPLASGDETLGVLIVSGSGLGETELQAVTTFAGQVAAALENVRLLEESRAWADELEQRVSERTADLAATEARYRRLFDTNRDGLYVLDMEGKCLDVNPAGSEMLGYGAEELRSLDLFQVGARLQKLSGAERAQEMAEMQALWRQGFSGEETELVSKTGDQIPVEVTANPLIYMGQEAVLAAARNITERRQADQELQQSREETLRVHRLLLALSQAGQAVQRALTPQEVRQTIADEVRRLGYHAIILTLSPDRKHASVSHATLPAPLLAAAEDRVGMTAGEVRIRVPQDDFLRRVLDEGKSSFTDDMAGRIALGVPEMDPDLLRQVTESLGIEQAIFAPLPVTGKTQGLLIVAGARLTEADVPAIEIFANEAGIALENARLVDQLTTNREELQVLARRVLTAQEEERQRLSRALHDEAGQALTALKINLELLAQDLPPGNGPLAQRVTDSASMVDNTMDQIRHLAQGLRPPALDALGLDPTLEGHCQDFAERTMLRIEYHGAKLPPLAEPVSITLYRFLQEALTNVARHANARQVDVALRHDAEEISLSVEDDGDGFVPGARATVAGKEQGLGLLGMQERLELLRGRLQLDSEPGRGTRVTAYIQMEEE